MPVSLDHELIDEQAQARQDTEGRQDKPENRKQWILCRGMCAAGFPCQKNETESKNRECDFKYQCCNQNEFPIRQTPTGNGFGDDSSRFAPVRQRSKRPCRSESNPVYQ